MTGTDLTGSPTLDVTRIQAVFLDAGNTLIHVDWARIAALAQAAGHPLSVEDLERAEYAGRAAVNRRIRHPDASDDRSRGPLYFGTILEAAGFPPEALEAFTPAVIGENDRNGLWCRVRPGTHEALEALRAAGFRLAIISNSDGRLASYLDRADLTRRVEFALDSHLEGVEKPEAALFERALERMGVPAEASLYVGDLYEVDVVGARQVGMQAVLLDPLGRDPARDVVRFETVATLATALLAGREP